VVGGFGFEILLVNAFDGHHSVRRVELAFGNQMACMVPGGGDIRTGILDLWPSQLRFDRLWA